MRKNTLTRKLKRKKLGFKIDRSMKNTIFILCLTSILSFAETELKFSGGTAGGLEVTQVIDLVEISKSNWSPGLGKPPLTVAKAIEIAGKYRDNHFDDGVLGPISKIYLTSYKVGADRKWCWLISYFVNDKSLTGRSYVVFPVSLTGKVMVSIGPEKND